MNDWVLDTSAVLALIWNEPGGQRVREITIAESAFITAVNLSEVIAKLDERGRSPSNIDMTVARIRMEVIPFDGATARVAGLLRTPTRALGLGLGDRACLALAQSMGAPVLTADRAWATLQLGVTVEVIR